MRAIERGVDLDSVEDCAVALEVRSRGRERRRMFLGNAPSSGADPWTRRLAPIHLTLGPVKTTGRKGLGSCLKPIFEGYGWGRGYSATSSRACVRNLFRLSLRTSAPTRLQQPSVKRRRTSLGYAQA